jgi:hypothetical protein
MLRALRKQGNAFLNSERALVLVETGDIPDNFIPDPNSHEVLGIMPVFRNYGKTPARIIRISIRSHKVPRPEALPAKPKYKNATSFNITLPPDLPIQPINLEIPLSDFIEIRKGNPVLYIYGFVDYVDFGKTERKSSFCFIYYVPSGKVSMERGFAVPASIPEAYTDCT